MSVAKSVKSLLKPLSLVFATAAAALPAHAQAVTDITPLIDKVIPSTVAIYTSQPLAGDEQGPPTRGLGSGSVINGDKCLIVTNNHVIDGAATIDVLMFEQNRPQPAELVGTDARTDIAVVRLKNCDKALPAVTLGDSDALRRGNGAFAIGTPLGNEFTVTAGIISTPKRTLNNNIIQYVQTDASINRGNSGGALFNLHGEQVGMNTLILSPNGGSIGLGFAIPSNDLKFISDRLIADGKISWGFLGATLQPVASTDGEDILPGVKVAAVSLGYPADNAGLQPGDIVTAINSKPVENIEQMLRDVAFLLAGTQAEFTYSRDGKESRTTVALTERPAEKIVRPVPRPARSPL